MMSDLRQRWREFCGALVFFTRLPMPAMKGSFPNLSQTLWAWPLVGVVVASLGWLIYLLLSLFSNSPSVIAVLTIFSMTLMTGALHEDGFADCADSFGAHDREKRLAILSDSRIGTYGAISLIFVYFIRMTGFGYLSMASPLIVLAFLVLIASTSRAMMLVPIARFTPAKSNGLGQSLKETTKQEQAQAAGIAMVVALICALVSGVNLWMILIVLLAMGMTVFGLSWFMNKRIGGYTGDTIGGAQIIAELAGWVAMTAVIS